MKRNTLLIVFVVSFAFSMLIGGAIYKFSGTDSKVVDGQSSSDETVKNETADSESASVGDTKKKPDDDRDRSAESDANEVDSSEDNNTGSGLSDVSTEENNTDEVSQSEDGKQTDNNDSKQSKEQFDFTGVKWSEELESELKDIDFNAFGFSVEEPTLISDVNSLFVLANKANYFPDNFVPIDLVSPKSGYMGGGDRNRLRKVAADALDRLVNEAASQGINIKNVSAYRSIEYQRGLFNSYAAKDGIEKANKYSSKPGHSEHHTGLCADVSSPSMAFGLGQSYGKTKEGIWLAENAHRYGFVVRYPDGKENITGYTYEPWHIRYFGTSLASYLYQTGLTYEEFIALQRGIKINDIIIK